MAQEAQLVAWQQELKVMVAAAKRLPLSAYAIDKADAQDLYMIKASLLYLEGDDGKVTRCYSYMAMAETLFKSVIQTLWQSVPKEICSSNQGTNIEGVFVVQTHQTFSTHTIAERARCVGFVSELQPENLSELCNCEA